MTKIAALLFILAFLTGAFIVLIKPITAISGDSWVFKESMHEARAYLGVSVVNGMLFAIGGDTGGYTGNGASGNGKTKDVTNVNEEYDFATDTWTLKAAMPTPRAGFGTVAYQGKIYCFGGWTYTTDYSNTNANEVYNPATDEWEIKTPLPVTGSFVIANAVNGRIYVLPLDYTGPLEVYDAATDSWINKSSPPNKVISRATAVVDDKLFFIARGFDPSSGLTKGPFIQIYDTLNDKWSVGTDSPTNGFTATAAATTNMNAHTRIYFFEETATYIYDPFKDRWTNGTAMPNFSDARTLVGNAVICICASAATVNDLIYVIGGRIGTIGFFTDVSPTAVNEQYTPVGYGTVHGTASPVDDVPPEITLLSPENKTYNTTETPLSFNVDESGSWMRYKLDNSTVVELDGNTTITGLFPGTHNLTIYATDAAGNTGSSETIAFTVTLPEPFPTVPVVVASGALAIAIAAGLLIYFKKFKNRKALLGQTRNNRSAFRH